MPPLIVGGGSLGETGKFEIIARLLSYFILIHRVVGHLIIRFGYLNSYELAQLGWKVLKPLALSLIAMPLDAWRMTLVHRD